MEGRVRKYSRQAVVSPERAKVWTERSPKYKQAVRKVAVVYYLCRNRQLEQPHFIEVSLSSPHGLYLRDVINRLNVLRGKGIASMYSWSCKRSYKSGFVWHDLSEDDLISPAHGSEYVLKGSELVDESNSGHVTSGRNMKLQTIKQLPEPSSSRSRHDSSSSSSLNGDGKNSQEDELSPTLECPGSSEVSSDSMDGKRSPWDGPLSLTEYKIYKSEGLADASTQTEENISKTKKAGNTCTRGVSTEDGSSEQDGTESINKTCDIIPESVSPLPSSSSALSSVGKTATLESLIRADASKFNSLRVLEEEEEFRVPPTSKLRPSNVLMQLISCGSISVKDHSFGIIPTYKPRFSNSKFPSPLFSTSLLLGELDCLSENPRLTGMRLEEKEYFSGSLIEKNLLKEGDVFPSLKRSSSYNADRCCKQLDIAADDQEEATSAHSKCIPRSIKASLSKNPKNESMRSPVSDKPRISVDGADCSRSIAPSSSSDSSSRRFNESSLVKIQAKQTDSFREDKENVVKIEERLASGARVIIQSTSPCVAYGNS